MKLQSAFLPLSSLIALTAIALPLSSHALGTDRAKGTPVNLPQQAVQAETCVMCHTTVKTLHTRGAHKDVNCGSCHTVKPEHMTSPKAENRPTIRFDYGACSQCHTSEHKELLDPKYHYQWAEQRGNAEYSMIRDQDDNWPRSIQYKFPRFHAGLMADFLANRSNGRFKYDSKIQQGIPQENHQTHISDAFPQNGELNKGDIIGLGWRPHKGREGQQDSRCLLCKTTETMLEYQYDVTQPNCPLLI